MKYHKLLIIHKKIINKKNKNLTKNGQIDKAIKYPHKRSQ